MDLGRCNPHLTPGVIDSLAKRLNLLQLGHIGGDDQHVPLTDSRSKLFPNLGQRNLIHISNRDFQSKSIISHYQYISFQLTQISLDS